MSSTSLDPRRVPVLAIVGSASAGEGAMLDAQELGRRAVDAGFRIVTGGLGGIMEAASRGARSSEAWTEGRIVGVVPSYDRDTANAWCDIVVPTGMQLARNLVVVAMADVVVAISGGAGTLSELALAWQLGKPLVALDAHGGWAEELAGRVLDHRQVQPIVRATTPEVAVSVARQLVESPTGEPGDIGTGWRRAP